MTRLRRIEGQVRGIQGMLGRMGEDVTDPSEGSDCDPCDSLLTQILAVRAAVKKVGLVIFELHLQQCIIDEPLSEERLQGLRDSLKLWARLA